MLNVKDVKEIEWYISAFGQCTYVGFCTVLLSVGGII